MSKIKKNLGFSFTELIIAIAIITCLVAISVGALSGLSQSKSLEKETANLLSIIERARNDAINSVGYREHGVEFASTTITSFNSTSVAASTETSQYQMQKAFVSALSLTGGSDEVYFHKLTGKPSVTGTITITGSGVNKTIIIYATGLVEVQ